MVTLRVFYGISTIRNILYLGKAKIIIECDHNTQYKIEERLDGLWSGGPEICIAHILNGKRSRNNSSIPLEKIPELIAYLTQAYGNMREDLAGQKDEPIG